MKVADRRPTDESVTLDDIVQREKLVLLGELVNGIAHELNNALTGALGFAQILSMRPGLSSMAQRDLGRVRADMDRCREIVHTLLAFARAADPREELLDVNEVARRTVPLREYELKGIGIRLSVEPAPGLPQVRADFQQLQQVLMAMILNAESRLRGSDGRHKEIIVGCRLGVDGETVELTVRHNSAGVSPEAGLRVAEWRSAGPEQWDGSARLAVVREIVEAHSGTFEVTSQNGGWTHLTVSLPAAALALAPAQAG